MNFGKHRQSLGTLSNDPANNSLIISGNQSLVNYPINSLNENDHNLFNNLDFQHRGTVIANGQAHKI